MNDIISLFEEYDDCCLVVTDFDIQFRGARVDTITLDENNGVHIWGGNPFEEDKFFEEYLPTKEERKLIFEEILENM